MHIDVIRSEEAWARMGDEWNQLLEESITNVPFLRHEYLMAWWQHRGGGEWPESELHVIVGRGEDGALAGIAPLFLSKNHAGERSLMLLGSIEISDFLDVIVREGDLAEFLTAMLGYLTEQGGSDWACLDWYNLLEESPTPAALAEAAQDHGLTSAQERVQPSPLIPLPRDFESYLAKLDKRYRHEMRRKLRNAAGFFLPVGWYVVEDGDSLAAEMEDFFALMREETLKNEFLTAAMEEQMRAIAMAAFEGGWLQLAFLTVGNDKAVGAMNFDYDNRIWVYNTGMGGKHDKLSPGIVMMGHLLMDSIEKGREAFDLMRGDEDYKYHLGGQDRYVVRVVVNR